MSTGADAPAIVPVLDRLVWFHRDGLDGPATSMTEYVREGERWVPIRTTPCPGGCAGLAQPEHPLHADGWSFTESEEEGR